MIKVLGRALFRKKEMRDRRRLDRSDPVWPGGAQDCVLVLDKDGLIESASDGADIIIGEPVAAGVSFWDAISVDRDGALENFIDAGRSDPQSETVFANKKGALFAVAVLPSENGAALARVSRAGAGGQKPMGENDPAAAMIADLAHEMKTPLNAIVGFADAMRIGAFGPLGSAKYEEYAEHICASGAHLSALITAAQDYGKTKTGRYAVEKQKIHPGDIIKDCAAMISGAVEKAGLALHVRVPEDISEADLDPRVVKQVLINLLSNAVKFTKTGSITLEAMASAGRIRFIVTDTGVGMNAATLTKIGARYSDTSKDGVRGTEGTGLGLSLAYEFARLHNGVLRFRSEPGAGTVATLILPIKDDKAGDAIADKEALEDLKSQLDRINAFRAERATTANAA